MLGDHTEMEVVVLSITNGKDKGNHMDESYTAVRTLLLLVIIHDIRVADGFFPK